VIDMDKVAQVCGAAKSDAGRANAVELIGSVEADKAGCKFLVADSERECDAWCTAIDAAVNGTDGTAAAAAAVASVGGGSSGGGGGAGGGTASASSGLASQLQQGFQQMSVSA
jgi:hypothetical protein